MRKLCNRTYIAVAAVALGGLAACQTSEPRRNPGALPSAKLDVAPRLNASTYVAHGHLLEQQGNFAGAVVQYRHALALTPDLLAARNRLGVTLNKLGQHAEASEEFRQALAQHPEAAHLQNNLGFSLYLEGRYAEAEKVLARAVELQPGFRRAHMNQGLALAKLGRYDEALAAFALAGPEADAYYNLAVLQTEAGRYADAARALEHALVLNPEFAEARQQLREVSRLAAAEEANHVAAELAEKVRAEESAKEAELAVAEAAEKARAAEAAQAAELAVAEAAENARVEQAAAIAIAEPVEVSVVPDSVAQITLAPEPVVDAEVVLAGGVETVISDATRALRVFQQVQTTIDERTAALPPSALQTINEDRLIALFAELVTALGSNTPWYDDAQCRTAQLLGVLDTPH